MNQRPKVTSIIYEDDLRVVLTYPRGERYVHDHKFHPKEIPNASRLVDRIEKHLSDGGAVNFAYWQEISPEFGSVAYELFQSPDFFKGGV